VAKHKLERFTELGTFNNVIQPETVKEPGRYHPIRGKWKKEIFQNDCPVILELGCGKGEYTIGLSSMFPKNNYIGIDIKGARMWRGAKTSHERKLPNVAFLRTRIEFINLFFSENEVEEIWITFPDPHTGRNNSNKRLTGPWFLNIYRNFLRDKGIIHLKTDSKELFEYTERVINRNNLEILASTCDLYSESDFNDALSIRTHYESIFLRQGMKIKYLSFRLDNKKSITDDRQTENKK
jgi:tRNA (guanine-N7-)-methyltransferase